MSNVLIGIIGVILFIGLALAGALFLGPRFQEATVNSKASAYVSAVKQMADAGALYVLQEGTALPQEQDTLASTLVSKGYLKSAPVPEPKIYAWAGTTKAVSYLALPLGADSDRLCGAIQRQSGQIAPGSQPDLVGRYEIRPETPAGISSGCVRNGVAADSPLTVFARF